MLASHDTQAEQSFKKNINGVGSSIVVRLEVPEGALLIEKTGKGSFRLSFTRAQGVHDFEHLDNIRRSVLEDAIPFFAFRKSVIQTRIGPLYIQKGEEVHNLKCWLGSFPK